MPGPAWLPCARAASSRGACNQPGREIRGGAALLPDATNRKPAGRCGRAMTRAGLQPGSAGGIQGGVQEVAAAIGREASPRRRRWQGAGSRRRCAMCATKARAGAEAAKWESRIRGGGSGLLALQRARSPFGARPRAALRRQGVRTVRDSGSLVAAACLRGIRLARRRPGKDRVYGKAGRCRAARPGLLLTFSIRGYRLFVTIANTVASSLFF